MSIHRIYFKARNWEFNRSCTTNQGERCYISGITGELEEVFHIGTVQDGRTEITSKPMMLQKDSIYRFSFWLREEYIGQGPVTCLLQVIFDGKSDQMYQYKLEQNYITPVKIVNGWKLYDVAFETQHNSMAQLKLAVENMEIMVMPASDPEDYKGLADDRKAPPKKATGHNPFNFGPYTSTTQPVSNSKESSEVNSDKEIMATELYQKIMQKLDAGCMQQQIVDDIVEELVERVKQNIDLESLVTSFSESINMNQLQDELREVIKEHLNRDK